MNIFLWASIQMVLFFLVVLILRMDRRMGKLLRSQVRVLRREEKIMADLQPIIDQVTNISGVVDSAVATFTEVAARLLAAQNDPAEIASIATALQDKATALGQAIASVPPAA
jgi:hypothetical protein